MKLKFFATLLISNFFLFSLVHASEIEIYGIDGRTDKVVANSDGSFLAVANKYSVSLFSTQTGRQITSNMHCGFNSCDYDPASPILSISPNGRYVLYGSAIFEVETGKLVYKLNVSVKNGSWFKSIDWSPTGEYLLVREKFFTPKSPYENEELRVIDIIDWNNVKSLFRYNYIAGPDSATNVKTFAAWSPNGKLISLNHLDHRERISRLLIFSPFDNKGIKEYSYSDDCSTRRWGADWFANSNWIFLRGEHCYIVIDTTQSQDQSELSASGDFNYPQLTSDRKGIWGRSGAGSVAIIPRFTPGAHQYTEVFKVENNNYGTVMWDLKLSNDNQYVSYVTPLGSTYGGNPIESTVIYDLRGQKQLFNLNHYREVHWLTSRKFLTLNPYSNLYTID